MMSNHALRCIDLLLKELMQNDSPFRGKVILLSGDFQQTLAVVLRASITEIIEAWIKCSPLWRSFERLILSINMRTKGQQDFNE